MPTAKVRRRVVIVEHDPTYLDFLSKIIRGLGHEVVEINDDQATDFSELKVSDIVILDVMSPRGEGLRALKAIARLGANCPVVLMCGTNDHPHDAEEFAKQLRLSVVGILKKPFRHSELEKILGDV